MATAMIEKFGGLTLVVWEIAEGEERLREMVTGGDRESAERFAHAGRRLAHLAWRAALRSVLPHGEVAYDTNGAPYVDGWDGSIAAAHADGAAAVLICENGGRCGVDIESAERDVSRHAPRFVSERERTLPGSGRPEFPVAVWCAKEALYKYSGRRELDFLHDIAVDSADWNSGVLTGSLPGESGITLRLLRTGGHIVVFTLRR